LAVLNLARRVCLCLIEAHRAISSKLKKMTTEAEMGVHTSNDEKEERPSYSRESDIDGDGDVDVEKLGAPEAQDSVPDEKDGNVVDWDGEVCLNCLWASTSPSGGIYGFEFY
jgi:hypothetical protein